eukprot:Clim_evm26s243 gene=Clim_evmTU26s243
MADKMGKVIRYLMSHVPPPLRVGHKGQAGKIMIVGGCDEYTGAPYYAAESSLRAGADLAFVLCSRDAAPVIKSYSPELIVRGVFATQNEVTKYGLEVPQANIGRYFMDEGDVISWIRRSSAVVIGPGLGRDKIMLECATAVALAAVEHSVPLLFDGDGCFLLSQNRGLVQSLRSNSTGAGIVTPNVNEFRYLWEAFVPDQDLSEDQGTAEEQVKKLSTGLGGMVVVRKAEVDTISCEGASLSLSALRCDEQGNWRRSGGQGDVLAGTMGTFLSWAFDRKSMLAGVDKELIDVDKWQNRAMLAALGAATLTRRAGYLAFQQCGRSTTTPDVIQSLGRAFDDIFGDQRDPKNHKRTPKDKSSFGLD